MTNAPDLCRECGGHCCLHPVMTDEEYQRLVSAIGEEKARNAAPQQYGTLWMFREHCPGKRSDGCVLEYDDRPLTCKVYPFVAIPALTGSVLGHEILLDLRHCPRWKEFGERYEETKQEFIELKSREAATPSPGKPRRLKHLFRK